MNIIVNSVLLWLTIWKYNITQSAQLFDVAIWLIFDFISIATVHCVNPLTICIWSSGINVTLNYLKWNQNKMNSNDAVNIWQWWFVLQLIHSKIANFGLVSPVSGKQQRTKTVVESYRNWTTLLRFALVRYEIKVAFLFWTIYWDEETQ